MQQIKLFHAINAEICPTTILARSNRVSAHKILPPTQIRAQNKVPYLILYLTIFGCFFSSQVCRKELGSHRIEA